KLSPKNVEMYRQYAMLKTDQGNRPEARKKIEEGLKSQPREPNLLWLLAIIQVQEAQDSKATENERATHLKGAQATVEEMKRIPTVPKPMIDLVNAQILFTKKEWLPASREFARLSNEFRHSPEQAVNALVLVAQCYQQLGEFDKQLDASRQ